jgi:hypothetical protein
MEQELLNYLIIESDENTSHIDNLLISLFYPASIILNDMLITIPLEHKYMYLQELIHNNFINKIKAGYTIPLKTLYEIRNYFLLFGIKINDVINLYDNLLTVFNTNKIKYEARYSLGNNFVNEIYNQSYITFLLTKNCRFKEMINAWMDKYKLRNIPHVFGFKIDRMNSKEIEFDIQKKFKFIYKGNVYKWAIQSVICESECGDYYSIFINNSIWYLYNNKNMPAISKIDFKDNTYNIKKDCTFLIYKIDSIYPDSKN